MRVRFWGTRGSIPTPLTSSQLKTKIRKALVLSRGADLSSDARLDQFIEQTLPFTVVNTFGGDSPCMEIENNCDEYLICDLGTGLRRFGGRVLAKNGPDKPKVFNFVLSHVHWDHIMGFPFFAPAYIPGNKIRMFGCHDTIESALRYQHSGPCFPVEYDALGADIEYVRLEVDQWYDIADLKVKPMRQHHTGVSYGYRFEKAGKSIVYSTDSEHKLISRAETEAFVAFFHEADLVVFDAMYSLADAVTIREDWGHSSNIVGVELCQMAQVKHLCLFHHEPTNDDDAIQQIFEDTLRLEAITRTDHPLRISAAYDGLEIEV